MDTKIKHLSANTTPASYGHRNLTAYSSVVVFNGYREVLVSSPSSLYRSSNGTLTVTSRTSGEKVTTTHPAACVIAAYRWNTTHETDLMGLDENTL